MLMIIGFREKSWFNDLFKRGSLRKDCVVLYGNIVERVRARSRKIAFLPQGLAFGKGER